jgi:uncharacterized protein (UPF0248 family)
MVLVPRKGKSSADDGTAMRRTAREVLNELRWRDPNRLPDAVIVYRDRARLEGFQTIRGSEILELQRRYFTTAGARLPYYKIERIEVAGRIQFQRGTVERRANRTSGP